MLKITCKNLLIGMIVSCLPMLVHAQNLNQDLVQRMERLEKDTKLLSQKVFQQSSQTVEAADGMDLTGDILTDFELRLTKVEKHMSLLYGKFESLDYAIEALNKSYNISTQDTEMRLQDLENKAIPAAIPDTPKVDAKPSSENVLGVITQEKTAPKAVTKDATQSAQGLYNSGFDKLRAGKYDEARAILTSFMASFPEHELAGNVQYWLGETSYVTGDYKKAIVHFGDAYRKYPQNSKSEESLLKLAMSLSKVGRKQEACLALDQLVNTLENVPQAVKRQAATEVKNNQCKV